MLLVTKVNKDIALTCCNISTVHVLTVKFGRILETWILNNLFAEMIHCAGCRQKWRKCVCPKIQEVCFQSAPSLIRSVKHNVFVDFYNCSYAQQTMLRKSSKRWRGRDCLEIENMLQHNRVLPLQRWEGDRFSPPALIYIYIYIWVTD